MTPSYTDIVDLLRRMKKKEIRALDALKKTPEKDNQTNQVYYGARIGMINEIMDAIDALI